MNKIYKVMYSKVKQCAVVVSEIAKSHGHNGESSSVRKHAALMAAVLIALGSLSIEGMPVAQADANAHNNDFIGANDYYWYWDAKANNWEQQTYRDALIGHLPRHTLPNNEGAGAKETGSIAAGLYAQAGMQTVTIGNRNAGQSRGSVFIGEHSGYDDKAGNIPQGSSNNYVTSVGFQSDATGWGSIAIGSNATAKNTKKTDVAVTMTGNTDEDKKNGIYEIEKNPMIEGASVALGYSAQAQNGNIAIGAYSEATTDLSADTSDKAKSYLTGKTATSYVSVGKDGVQRRISNVADGAADTDVATIKQLKQAVSETDASKKANIDASNIGKNLKQADGTTAAESTDITTNENKWGAAIGTGKVADPTKSGKNDPTQNGAQQLVTGGTVYTALQNQKNDLTKDLSVHADWGITITNNYIGLSRNLGNIVKINGERDPSVKIGRYGLILGGEFSRYISYFNRTPLRNTQYGASGDNSVIVGGFDNLAKGSDSVVLGGWLNEATGKYSSVLGGYENVVEGSYSTIMGGHDNFITGTGVANGASIVGGHENVAFAGAVVIGGSGNHAGNNFVDYLPIYSVVIGGSGNQAVGDGSVALGGGGSNVYADGSTGIGGGSTAYEAYNSLAAGPDSTVTVSNGTAIGYKATTNQKGTIAFGHDKGDIYFDTNPRYDVGDALARWPQKAYRVSQNFYDANGKKITENEYMALMNPDYTWNDYSKRPYFEETYDRAYYNRLVKVADGVEDHDVVVMEQLKNASDVGNNIKVYKTDENGNVQFDENNKPIEDTSDAATTAQNGSKDAWGQALGAAPFTAGTATTVTNASTSDQLVTGSTLYDYDKPTGSPNYVKVNNTTGQNLSALDAQVKANADALTKPNHNIKFYNVDDKILKYLPKVGTYSSNEANDGAKGMGSMAAGVFTHSDGIASTVAGSYSGVLNQDPAGINDLRGAAALSYGTFNINQNTDATKAHSGVANSIIGQVNMTKNSNAAIIYGAGNIVTDSYRPIDEKKAAAILGSVNDPAQLGEAMKDAVESSGGQVMVMGGGNNVDKAYMTQVTGVGNKVTGQDSTYAEKTSTQYNFVDGFQNELKNGKNDYIIGTKNKVSGDSVDKNQSNIIFGDNHKLTNQKNNVIIGSSDEVTEMAGSDAVSIGHNANAGGASVALGSNAVAGGNALAVGPNANAKNNSIALGIHASATSSQNLAIGYYANVTGRPDTIKNSVALGSSSTVGEKDILSTDNEKGVLSIGAKDNERRIIHVRAGVNDTDAVNVSQLKSVQSGLTDKGLTFVTNDGEHTAKLGSKVTIQGTAKKADHEYTADNLTTAIDKDGNITILMDKDMSTEKLTVNGKDGKDGQPGTAGSIGIKGQDGDAGIGIDGKDGISIKGTDGKDGVTIKVDNGKDGKDGSEGHIGLNGRDGSSIDITVKNGYDGANGINGKNGVDGTSLTRIVYTDKTGEYQVATLEDGLKFKGDDSKEIAKKLNNTMEIIGGADSKTLTEGNIGVNSTDKGQLKVQLAKDLTGITSISNQKTEGDKTTGAKIDLGTDGSVNVNGGKITNVGSGADASGKYTETTNVANIGDVQNMVNDAKTELTDGANGLNKKANIDASNIGSNITVAPIYQKDEKGRDVIGQDGQKVIDQKATEDAQNAARTANENDWGSAIGTGKIAKDNGQLVTGKTVYDEVRPMEDGSYVKKDQTTGENLSALDTKIGKLDEDGNYIKKDDSISKNLSTLDTHVKKNADDITNINKSISTLDQNAVKYDDSNKSKVTLAEGGTTITKVKDGALNDKSTDAVNGKQLYAEQQARKELETKVTSNTTEINNIKDGKGFTDKGKEVIRDLAKGSVKVIAGTNTTVTPGTDKEDGAKTYAVNVEGNGKIASGDTGLISGDTLYKEVHVDNDGSYVKSSQTVGQNLSALDTGLKTTSDLIQTNGDTIQIGGNSTATKIDVHGKDSKGNTTGRVITGVVTDDGDPTSAANVGYVNGVTAANTQQIYRDMNNAYGRLNNNINKAAAGSNALAALHPLDYDPDDKADFAVGYGHYRNANAAAVGAFYHPNENTMVNVGVSLGNGDPGFNAGVSFKIGSGSAGHQAMSKTEMAKVINSQSKEIDALKKDNADKDKRIDALEQKMAEILAKLDKNGK